MALTESDIKIIIAGELKKKGFQDAERATSSLEKKFKSLAKTVVAVFSVREVVQFGKAAVKAFSEDEVAARRFESALTGVNLGFATPEIENYLENLEKFTAITKGQLRPAFQTLASTTRSVAMSQDILNTAIDVSAGTGVDLQTVINDLSKSFLGNNASLAKYELGLSKSELKAKSFNEIQELLNNQFSGQRAAFLDTYAGKVSLLEASYERMQTTIGSGLVDAFTLLSGENGIAGATDAMERFGVVAADVIRGVGVAIDEVQNRIPFFSSIFDKSNIPVIGAYLDIFESLGKQKRPLFFPGGGIGQPGVDKRLAAIEEAAIKRQKELEALRNKQAKEQAKLNRLKQISLMLIQKEARFDLNRIQLAAALQGKLTSDERKRVEELLLIEEIKQAIAEKDVDKAETLLEELNKVREQTEALADKLLNLKASDPFEGWDERIKDLSKQIDEMTKKRVMDFLANFTFGTFPIPQNQNPFTSAAASDAASAARQGEIQLLLGDAEAARAAAEAARREAEEARRQAEAALAAAKTAEERAAAEEAARAAAEAAAAAEEIEASAAALDAAAASRAVQDAEIDAREAERMAEILAAEAAARDAAAALLEGQLEFDASVIGATAAGVPLGDIILNITVEGNVTTQEDLVGAITDQLYQYQKSGKGLLFSSVAI